MAALGLEVLLRGPSLAAPRRLRRRHVPTLPRTWVTTHQHWWPAPQVTMSLLHFQLRLRVYPHARAGKVPLPYATPQASPDIPMFRLTSRIALRFTSLDCSPDRKPRTSVLKLGAVWFSQTLLFPCWSSTRGRSLPLRTMVPTVSRS